MGDQGTLVIVIGILISQVLSRAPKLSTWFNGLDGDSKRAIVVILVSVCSIAVSYAYCNFYGASEYCGIDASNTLTDAVTMWLGSQVGYTFLSSRSK